MFKILCGLTSIEQSHSCQTCFLPFVFNSFQVCIQPYVLMIKMTLTVLLCFNKVDIIFMFYLLYPHVSVLFFK